MPPRVSIIVPCYNEAETIGSLLGAILDQTYAREQIEVVVADGLSQDKTREIIADFSQAHPDLALRVVENARRTIPSSLNLAMGQARGDIIVRLDAHSIPIPSYLERCVQAIEQEKGSNVGGQWIIRPGGTGWIAKGIAGAAAHALGAGDAVYRLGGAERAVDTVPFGAFRRSLIERIGGFDETLLTNEDYEFNVRVQRAGGIVWFDPQIRSTYVARSTLRELGRQYWRYGFWKCRMLWRHPRTLRWRQALPPAFLLGLLGTAVLAGFWRPALVVLASEIGIYLLALTAAGIELGLRSRDILVVPGSVLALATMHLAWGSGFLWSALAMVFGSDG